MNTLKINTCEVRKETRLGRVRNSASSANPMRISEVGMPFRVQVQAKAVGIYAPTSVIGYRLSLGRQCDLG